MGLNVLAGEDCEMIDRKLALFDKPKLFGGYSKVYDRLKSSSVGSVTIAGLRRREMNPTLISCGWSRSPLSTVVGRGLRPSSGKRPSDSPVH